MTRIQLISSLYEYLMNNVTLNNSSFYFNNKSLFIILLERYMCKLIRSILIFASVCMSLIFRNKQWCEKRRFIVFLLLFHRWEIMGGRLFSLYSEISLAYSILLVLILVRITENVTIPLFSLYNEISNNDPTRTASFSLQPNSLLNVLWILKYYFYF